MRPVALLLLCCWLHASEGHQFILQEVGPFAYSVNHRVTWDSAGDKLTYQSKLEWVFTLQPLAVSATSAQLAVAIYRVKATHSGPGANYAISSAGKSAEERGEDDALLGNQLALADARLELTVDPRTGEVSAVSGVESLITSLAKANPGPAGSESPIVARAREVYAPDRLAAMWSRILAVPRTGVEQVTLPAPLSGSFERHWDGNRYRLALPTDGEPITVSLAADPTPVELTLTKLAGEGVVELLDGVLLGTGGSLRYSLSGSAMTQSVTQQHELTWGVQRIMLEAFKKRQPAASPLDERNPGEIPPEPAPEAHDDSATPAGETPETAAETADPAAETSLSP